MPDSTSEDDDYGLSPNKEISEIEAPPVDYLPPHPASFKPQIGMIGTGGISEFHLKAYRKCGYEVVGFHSRTKSKAEEKRDEFYPDAEVFERAEDLLADASIDVVDITPHPDDRLPILRAALKAGKHVLSQKPFALDLSTGRELADLADANGVKLAVNQNGRWAPHFSYMRNAIASGLIGDVTSVDFSLQWDQTWVAGIEHFESIHHLILFDFAVHWFDITCCFMGGKTPKSVFASGLPIREPRLRPTSGCQRDRRLRRCPGATGIQRPHEAR